MIPRIKSLKAIPDYKLSVEFDDGVHVLYDVNEDIAAIPSFKPLCDVYGLFNQVMLDESRTCVYWNDQIDLASDSIYEYGRKVKSIEDDIDSSGTTAADETELHAF